MDSTQGVLLMCVAGSLAAAIGPWVLRKIFDINENVTSTDNYTYIKGASIMKSSDDAVVSVSEDAYDNPGVVELTINSFHTQPITLPPGDPKNTDWVEVTAFGDIEKKYVPALMSSTYMLPAPITHFGTATFSTVPTTIYSEPAKAEPEIPETIAAGKRHIDIDEEKVS